MTKPNLWICAFDTHWPKTHMPTFKAMLDFMTRNQDKIAGFVWGGDQMHNDEISHFNAGKALFRVTGSYLKNHKDFQAKILDPVNKMLPKEATKIWIEGNHCHWSQQLVESSPELKGLVENHLLLGIEKQGWKFIPCGSGFKLGKLTIIHGETLSGIGNQAAGYHAKKAVETYAGSVLYGHMHSPQSFTKVLPHDKTAKWQGTCAPILGCVNPTYLRNRPSGWLTGFCIVETQDNGNYNLYTVIVVNGKFSFGGELYGEKK